MRLADRVIVVTGSTGIAEPTDLTDEKATEAAFGRCLTRFGRIDGLAAVAGGSGRPFGDGLLHEIPLDGWEETLRINGHPTFLAAREGVRAMRSQEPNTSGTRGSVRTLLCTCCRMSRDGSPAR